MVSNWVVTAGASGTKFCMGPAWASSEPPVSLPSLSLICSVLHPIGLVRAPFAPLLSFKLPSGRARTIRPPCPTCAVHSHPRSGAICTPAARRRPPHGPLHNHTDIPRDAPARSHTSASAHRRTPQVFALALAFKFTPPSPAHCRTQNSDVTTSISLSLVIDHRCPDLTRIPSCSQQGHGDG